MALTYAVSPSSSGFSPAFCVKRCRLNNEIGAMLGTFVGCPKSCGAPGSISAIALQSAKAAKLLFKELVKVKEVKILTFI
uniref:hypothetical protein n=1 Tax=Hassallia byssoidea TaxID=482630 RepID=UPI0005852472|nr:hypothetical protein [Hassalia byssoidea]